eukprot:COSAG04_NODE_781_length_10327_cov_151.194466_7_plen_61_part_00
MRTGAGGGGAYAGGIAMAGQADTASVLRPGLRSPISVTALSSIERQHEISSCEHTTDYIV